jgi:hypothetical protein
VKIKYASLILVFFIMAVSMVALATENRGAETMVLYGGKSGKVPFPHAAHQDNLKDCAICHDLFPQQQGAIEDFKKAGKLKKKKVMRQCTRCHRKTAKAGQKSGPTRCKTCHQK